MKKTTILLILIWGFCIIAKEANYKMTAERLAEQTNKVSLCVSVGTFVYGDTKLMSAFSSILRDELRGALAKTDKFKVISRERLDEIMTEQRLQQTDMLEPGSKKCKIQIKGVEGIVRGKFYYRYPKVTVFVELVCLDGLETKTAKLELNASDIPVEIIPANLKKSEKNIVDIRDRIKKVPHDFNIKLTTIGLRRSFRNGEKVRFKVRSTKDCHIAVFCHQNDGSTVLLFPNNWNSNTMVKADTDVFVPKSKNKKFEIEVGSPFGSDVVQVIACTHKSALHRKMEQLVRTPVNSGYRCITRGLFSKAVDESVEYAHSENTAIGKPQWSENHMVISTYK
jgi:hypothetical protein